MDPEEDFLTWSVILSTSFESGEYATLLPSFTGLVSDILTTSKLHGVLEEHTDYFLNNVLPDTVRSVLSLNYLTYDRDTSITFLVTVLPLISWAAIHDNFNLAQILMQILDVKSNLYVKNQTYRSNIPYEEVTKNYTNQDMNIQLFDFIKENCPPQNDNNEVTENDNSTDNKENETKSQNEDDKPSNANSLDIIKLSIHHFDVLFYGYCLIEESDMIEIEDISNIVEITPYFIRFINYFKSEDRLRELDTTILNRSFQSLMVILLAYPQKPCEAHVFQPLLEIANDFVQSEMLEKQLIGAAVLSKAAESRESSKVKKVFQEWANTTTLADFLINKDIHAKLLEELDPVLSKIITPKHLESFWEKAEQAHSTERSTMLSIIASTLKKFDENITLNFIDRITSADSISPELLEFLATVAKSFASANLQLSIHIIDTLIDYGEKVADDVIPNGSVTALAIFAPYNSSSQCQKRIINVCSERLVSNPSKQKFYIQVLKNMISSTYPSKNDFSKNFLTALVNAISNPDFEKYQNRPELYDILSLLVTKKKFSIDIDMFNTLISFRVDDLLWKFLNEIITKIGTDAYDSDVKEKIRITAKQVDFKNNSSLIFVQFLTQFILILNLQTGNVKSEYHTYYMHSEPKTIPNNYVITYFPPERIGLLFKVIIFTKDEGVASEAESKVLMFIEKTKNLSSRKVISTLIDYFKKVSNFNTKKKQIQNENDNKETNEDNKEEAILDTKEESNEENKDDKIDAETENAEYIAKARILKLILQYIDSEEKECYIEDYGVSRHKEKSEVLKKRRSNYDEINLNIEYGNKRFTMKTSKLATVDDLTKRISRRFEASNLYLYLDGTTCLTQYSTLYSASVKNGSTIMVKQFQSHDQKTVKKMPSMILHEENFSKPMLEILSKSSPVNNNEECITSLDNLQKIVFTILKRLPSDNNIVQELDHMDVFIKNLSDSLSNTRLFLYRIQILLTSLENNSSLLSTFVEHGGAKLLSDYLLNHEAPFHGLTLILKTLIIIFNDKLSPLADVEFDINEYDEKLIFYTLNLFDLVEKRPEIKKSLVAAVNFLVDFLQNDRKRTSEIIYKHPDLLEKMIDDIDNNDNDVYIPFIKFISCLDDKVQLFHLCVSMLNKSISQGSSDNNVSIDPNIIYIIRNTIPYVNNLEDIKIVLDNCWKMMAKYESTLNVIPLTTMNPILPVPPGYDENNIKDSKKLINATHSSGNQTAQLSGICQIINSILSHQCKLSEDESKNTSHILHLLKLAVSTDNDEVQKNLFDLLLLLFPSSFDKEQYDIVIQKLRESINEIQTDRWNYKPSTFAKSSTGFTGLRNLGSTCYMNSIFQQLFFTFPFTYMIILSDMESPLPPPPNQNNDQNKLIPQNEGNQKLKELFTQLILTKRRCCDTQPFCSSWKGWGKRLINPREQQDANEFLQFILDQLPSQLNSPFKGEFKNVIEGVSEDFYSFNIEQFYSICLEIKGYKDVMASFECLINREPLKGESQYTVSQDHKIDAEKYEMIKTAPDILVLQLKRFEYNLTNFERIKVNDRYEFPEELNIAKFIAPDTEQQSSLSTASNSRDIGNSIDASNSIDISNQSMSTNIDSNNSNKYKYELTGVVVHSGNAEGGHYYSIIRIDNKWIKFNDIEVTEITQEEFENETYGGQQTNKTNSVYNEYEESTGASAYLLFYRKINAIYETDLPVSLFKQCLEKHEPQAKTAQEETKAESTKTENQEEAKTEPVTATQEETKAESTKTENQEEAKTAQEETKAESTKTENQEEAKTAQEEAKAESTKTENQEEAKTEPVAATQEETKAEPTKTENQEEAKTEALSAEKNDNNSNTNDEDSRKTVHVKLRYDRPFDLAYLCDRNIINGIEKDNNELVKLQSIFSHSMFDFTLNSHKVDDLECLISYFFRIFCHSSFSHEATSMQFHIVNFINTEEQWNFCIEYIIKYFKELVEPILINCSITEIMECATQFITSIIANVSPEKSFAFVEELLRTLVYVLNASWRQVPHVSELMKNFVIQGDQQVSIALENNWINKFLDFITLVYDPTQQNDLILLLSPSATPTSSNASLSKQSSALSYTTSNTSSGNLVQQITRSTVVLQNINLTNVFLILNTLFDSCPSKDYERIVKYSSSILQSPSHSPYYINLLKKMSENDVIDINALVNAITTNKKEIDNDLVFDVILNVLLNTDDQNRIESLIAKVCPQVNASLSSCSSSNSAYGMNSATLSLTTAFAKRILNLVKQKNQQVIDFLLKYPAQTIFRFLIDNDKTARNYGEKIVMNIFKKVSKLSEKDREKIINKNNNINSPDENKATDNKSDSSDENNDGVIYNVVDNFQQKNVRKSELSEEDRKSMNDLYIAMVEFIFDFEEEDISQYYEKETENYSNQDYYHFINFLNVFEWLIIRLNFIHNEYSVNAVQMLFRAFSQMKNRIDYNMINCVRIINLFSIDAQQGVFKDNYEALFVKWDKIPMYDISQMFNLFGNYLIYHCRPCDALVVFKHPSMKIIHKELMNGSTDRDAVAFNIYNSLVSKYIDDDSHQFVEENKKVEEEFSLKQIIYMDTKDLFSNELSGISSFFTPQYTRLVLLCYRYMNIQMRKNLMKECAKTLNLKKNHYSNYFYETDNSKKVIEASNIIMFVESKPELLKHEVVPVQKDRFYDLILKLRDIDIQTNYVIEDDNIEPYDDDGAAIKQKNMNAVHGHSYIINQAINDEYEDFGNYDDEEKSAAGTYFPIQISGSVDNNDENNPAVYERVFIKWEKFYHNYLSIENENSLYICSHLFSLISKEEIKENIKKKKLLNNQIQNIKTQIRNQSRRIQQLQEFKQQQREEKEKQKLQRQQQKEQLKEQQQNQIDQIEEEEMDDSSSSDDDEEPTLYAFLRKLQNQQRQKENELSELNDDLLSFQIFDQLNSSISKSRCGAQDGKICILMTDFLFIIMDYRLLLQQQSSENKPSEDAINEKAIQLVKTNNVIQSKHNSVLSSFFIRTVLSHYLRAHAHNQNQNQVNENLDDIDNWSVYFVTKTINNFSYNRFSFIFYSKVLMSMSDHNVIELFKVFCNTTQFSEVINYHHNRYRQSYYDSSSSDDDMYMQSNKSQECRPIEDAFNQAVIFFKSKPHLKSRFREIFPLKFSQITDQNFYAEKSYIQEIYGNSPPGFENESDNQIINEKNSSKSYDDDEDDDTDNNNNIIIGNEHAADDNDDENNDNIIKGNVESYSDSFSFLSNATPSNSNDLKQNQDDEMPDYYRIGHQDVNSNDKNADDDDNNDNDGYYM